VTNVACDTLSLTTVAPQLIVMYAGQLLSTYRKISDATDFIGCCGQKLVTPTPAFDSYMTILSAVYNEPIFASRRLVQAQRTSSLYTFEPKNENTNASSLCNEHSFSLRMCHKSFDVIFTERCRMLGIRKRKRKGEMEKGHEKKGKKWNKDEGSKARSGQR